MLVNIDMFGFDEIYCVSVCDVGNGCCGGSKI